MYMLINFVIVIHVYLKVGHYANQPGTSYGPYQCNRIANGKETVPKKDNPQANSSPSSVNMPHVEVSSDNDLSFHLIFVPLNHSLLT